MDVMVCPAADIVCAVDSAALDRAQEMDVPYMRRLLCCFRRGPEVVCVCDSAPGGPLAGLVQRDGAVSTQHVATMVAEMLHIIAHLHSRGIAHGSVAAAAAPGAQVPRCPTPDL